MHPGERSSSFEYSLRNFSVAYFAIRANAGGLMEEVIPREIVSCAISYDAKQRGFNQWHLLTQARICRV